MASVTYAIELRRIHPAASIKLLRIASARTPGGAATRLRLRRGRCVPAPRACRPRGRTPTSSHGRRPSPIAPDRDPSRGRPARSAPDRACGICRSGGTARPSPPGSAGRSSSGRCSPPDEASRASSARWTSCRNDSSMIPRAIADWLVMTTVAIPARFSSRSASPVHGNTVEQIEPIEIATLLDDRAVTIEKDSRSYSFGLTHRSSHARSQARARATAPSCIDDRSDTHAAYRDGTTPGESAPPPARRCAAAVWSRTRASARRWPPPACPPRWRRASPPSRWTRTPSRPRSRRPATTASWPQTGR